MDRAHACPSGSKRYSPARSRRSGRVHRSCCCSRCCFVPALTAPEGNPAAGLYLLERTERAQAGRVGDAGRLAAAAILSPVSGKDLGVKAVRARPLASSPT